ncbi:acyl carrier protein [Streptomyces sp. ISL-99]|uniref:acyl carrier protein n=1 Tax=Streptomyces sp. ISL-99 TaxID=2819193 RepID=UPI001BE911F4|nr:acyl carrier protein [Streptomyces sp. ISL-99]MBT2529337.1 acyl carrier protein [Streptomyces sp. ISL-99]
MSHEHQTLPGAAADAPPPAPLTELVEMLAGLLRLRPEQIDPGQTFRSLGVGSVLTVKFVSLVNARWGGEVKVTSLFEHPTPLALAGHVAQETETLPAPAPVPVSSPTPLEPAAQDVLDLLCKQLAGILHCAPEDIDSSAPFNLLGVDSIRGAQFVAAINLAHGMNERAVALYDHPNLAAMAVHIAHLTKTAAPPPVPAGTGGAIELEALLDAVQADRLSVEEALTRLPRRV